MLKGEFIRRPNLGQIIALEPMSSDYSDEELLEDLRSVAEDLGRTPNANQYSELGMVTSGTLAYRFGSWNDSIRAAGLEINQEFALTQKDLLQELQRLNEEVRKTPPRKEDMIKKGKHSPRTYVIHFGSWNRAVEAAGFTPRHVIEDYEEPPDYCALCESRSSRIDFHHWRYGEDEVGCFLCRKCHDEVHRGNAKVLNTNWLPHCIERLVTRHMELHGEADPEEILERYNMPDVGPLVERAIGVG